MEEKYYWPLIGVLIGWLLNTVTNYSKFRVEQKLHRGRALTYLILIHDQLSLMNKHLEDMKDLVDSWKDYEPLRASQVKKHLFASEELQKNVENAFIELSGVDPLLSDKLISMKQALVKFRSINLEKSSKIGGNVYIHLLSSQEVVNELLEKEVKKEIYWLAFRYSVITWVRVMLLYRKRGKIKNTKMLDDVFSELNKMKSKESDSETKKSPEEGVVGESGNECRSSGPTNQAVER